MVSGGARARSGPAPDLFSGKSDRLGREVVELPAGGYRGYVPVFPLREIESVPRSRELELWKRLWRYPQAVVWQRERWRQDAVAHYVRLAVRVESDNSTAAEVNAMLRLREEIGLSPAGMDRNGWVVAVDETSRKRAEKKADGEAASRRRSFKVV